MAPARTEQPDDRDKPIDLWPTHEVVARILAVQQEALRAVEPAGPHLAAAIEVLAKTLRGGGRMAYAGAGSSGLLAQVDALELPGTFGIGVDRIPVILAGGLEALCSIPGSAEDDAAAAEAAVDRLELGTADAVVAVSASGETPFTVAALMRARRRGAVTVGIACVAGSSLLHGSHHPILLETPPEVIAGSTRMGAGTAQKCALNILSTGIAVRLGHSYAGLMVNMRPDNAKLKARAVEIVRQAAGVGQRRAEQALAEADWSVKTAIVCCARGIDAAAARSRLAESGDDIRTALSGSTA